MGLLGSLGGLTSKLDDIKEQATQKVSGLKSTAASLKEAGLDKVNDAKSAASGLAGGLKDKAAGEVAKLKKFQRVAQDELGEAGKKFKDGVGILSDLDLPASAKQLAGEALTDPSKLGGLAGPIKNAPVGLKGLLNDPARGAVYAITHFDPAGKVLRIAKAGLLKNGIPTFG